MFSLITDKYSLQPLPTQRAKVEKVIPTHPSNKKSHVDLYLLEDKT